MSTWHYPKLIHVNANARNGMVPNAYMWRQLVDAENHITGYRHRQVYAKSLELGTDTSGVSSLAGRFRFRTGYGVNRCRVVILIGLTSASAGAGSAADPYVEVDFTISGGATTTLGPYRYAVSQGTINDGPDEWAMQTEEATVTENTVYECWFRPSNYARIMSIMVYELAPTTVDEATNYMNTHSPVGGSPVYDADRERLLSGLSNRYRQGACNVHWGLIDNTSRTRSSATEINIVDNATTGTPTATHYGFYLDPQYHNTATRTQVPFQLAAYGSIGAGSGTVRLIDTAGNAYCTVTINGASGWYTATGNLPATETFYAIQYAGDGVNTVSVSAVSLIEWESGP